MPLRLVPGLPPGNARPLRLRLRSAGFTEPFGAVVVEAETWPLPKICQARERRSLECGALASGSQTARKTKGTVRIGHPDCRTSHAPFTSNWHHDQVSIGIVLELRREIKPLRPMLGVEDTFGMFADDPEFDEIVRLGREYREQANAEGE